MKKNLNITDDPKSNYQINTMGDRANPLINAARGRDASGVNEDELQTWGDKFDRYFETATRPKAEKDLLLLVKHWISKHFNLPR